MGCASSAQLPREPQQAPAPPPPYIPPEHNPQNRPGQQRTSEGSGTLTTAPVVRSLVSLRRDSCSVQEETGQWFLHFEFGSLATGTATASFLVNGGEEVETSGTLSAPSASSSASLRFNAETRQSGRLFLSADLPASLTDTQEGVHHVVLDLRADSEDPRAVTLQRNFLRLQPEGSGEVHVEKQLVQCGKIVRPLDALYGTLPNPRSRQADKEEGGDCVICLSNPREVAILHCRHVCLCSSCAKITSSTWSFQCPVCRGRVAAMVGLKELED